jgi:glycosyltransferase involved in cell wall biosynthesis
VRPTARKVLLALESSGPGGAERVVLELAGGLRRAGDDVVLLTSRPGWLVERARAEAIPCWVAPQASGLDPAWAPRLALRLRREAIDFVHTHEFAMNVYAGAAARLAGRPTLATLHGHRWIAERRRRRLAYRLLARTGMALGCVSRDLADHVARILPFDRARIHVVPNGAALGAPPARGDPASERLRRALAADGPLLLAVGNLYPVKEHATAVRALPRLPGATLAIAGRGPEEAALRALAASLGVASRLRLLGVRDDVAQLLRAADVVVHPSRLEGLPMALLEAMAAARPVVASRVGGIPEAVDDGVTGRLVPPGDPVALADAVGALLRDPDAADALGRAGRRRAEAEFSVERMVERYRALYDAVAGGRGGLAAGDPRSAASPRATR